MSLKTKNYNKNKIYENYLSMFLINNTHIIYYLY